MKPIANRIVLAICAVCVVLPLAAAPVQSDEVQQAPKDERISHEALQRFGHSLEAVRQLYVDDVSDKKILEHAIEGMLSGLDPHSTYLNEEEYQSLQESTKGEFTGVGMEVTMRNQIIYVVTPLDDSPAQKAGMKSGDMIMRIDGKAVKGMSLTKAVELMRGKPGTDVTLTVVRSGETAPLEIKMTRAKINVVSVKHRLIDQHYGYIRISSFGDKTNQAVRDALKDLQTQTAESGGLYGLVLDLRNNPGGLLEASIEVSDVFLDANTTAYADNVVTTKGRLTHMQMEGKADEPDLSGGIPIVAMINEGSASAAEIVAGALQDHQRAVVLGVRSFGKGSVQSVIPAADNKTALKITTARYYTPSGRSIQGEGIEPDVVVEALNIPEKAKPEQNFFIRESALEGSLVNEQSTGFKDHSADPELQSDSAYVAELLQGQEDQKPGEKPLYKDYQLHRAVDLLKVMHKSHRFVKTQS